jgi:hypothetical protein
MDVSDLAGEVRRFAKGCPDLRIHYALNRAAREFCRQTWFLRRQQSFSLIVGQSGAAPGPVYPFLPPNGEEVINVKHAQLTQINSVAGAPIQYGSVIPLQFWYGTLVNPNLQQQQPTTVGFIPYTSCWFAPTPDKAYPVQIELITQPVVGTTYLPDELGREWDQALAYGALSWILRQNGNAWTDPQSARDNLVLFNQQIIRARTLAAYDFTPNSRTWISPGFARRA